MVLSERFLYTLTKYISVMLLELYHITSFQIFIEKSRFYPVGTGHKMQQTETCAVLLKKVL